MNVDRNAIFRVPGAIGSLKMEIKSSEIEELKMNVIQIHADATLHSNVCVARYIRRWNNVAPSHRQMAPSHLTAEQTPTVNNIIRQT